jgi:hypothetical protein
MFAGRSSGFQLNFMVEIIERFQGYQTPQARAIHTEEKITVWALKEVSAMPWQILPRHLNWHYEHNEYLPTR